MRVRARCMPMKRLSRRLLDTRKNEWLIGKWIFHFDAATMIAWSPVFGVSTWVSRDKGQHKVVHGVLSCVTSGFCRNVTIVLSGL